MTFMSCHDNGIAGPNADTATIGGSDGSALQTIAQTLIANLTPHDIATLVAALTPHDIAPDWASSMVASNRNHGSMVGVPDNSTGNSGSMGSSFEHKAHTLVLPH